MMAVLSVALLLGDYTLANKNIALVVKGNEMEISTLKSNVKYDKNDIISLPLERKILDGDKIEVMDVIEKMIR